MPEARVDFEAPASRAAALDALVARRVGPQDEMFVATQAAIDGIDKAAAYFADCINCYNCRVACPVCFCKECVFVTDVFNHEPAQYLQWAERSGVLKMPTDTLFYHLTRLAHIEHGLRRLRAMLQRLSRRHPHHGGVPDCRAAHPAGVRLRGRPRPGRGAAAVGVQGIGVSRRS